MVKEKKTTVLVHMNEDVNKYINVYKSVNGFTSKDDAINAILKEKMQKDMQKK